MVAWIWTNGSKIKCSLDRQIHQDIRVTFKTWWYHELLGFQSLILVSHARRGVHKYFSKQKYLSKTQQGKMVFIGPFLPCKTVCLSSPKWRKSSVHFVIWLWCGDKLISSDSSWRHSLYEIIGCWLNKQLTLMFDL